MPTVPTYGVPGVQPTGVPGARLTPSADPHAFGAGVAAGAQDVAGDGASIIQHEQAKQRQVRIQDWSNRLAEQENQLLYDPNSGAFQTRGKQAFGVVQPTLKSYDDFAGTLQKETQDGTEQEQLRQIVDERRAGVERSLMNHVGRELQSFDETSFASGQASSRSAALENYQDPHRVDEEAYRQLGAIEGYAQRAGLPQAWVQDQQAKAQSATYAGVIGRMLDTGDDLAAKDALQRWGGALTGEDGARIDAAMKETSSRQASRRISDEITKDPKQDLEGALSALEDHGVKDANTYDQAKSRIVAHYQLQKQAHDQAQSDLFDQATSAVDSASDPAAPDAVPASIATALDPKYKRELLGYQAAKAKGVPIQTNWDVWYQLRSLASADATRDDFLGTDLRQFRSQLSDSEFKSMTDLQADLRQNGQKSAGTLVEWGLVDRVANQTMALKGLNPSTSFDNNPDLPTVTAFRRQLDNAVSAIAQSQPNRKVTFEDVQKAADRLVVDQTFTAPGRIYGTNQKTVPAFQAPGADKLAFTVDQIPPQERQRVIEGLTHGMKLAGLDDAQTQLTPQMIIDAYNRQTLQQAAANGR